MIRRLRSALLVVALLPAAREALATVPTTASSASYVCTGTTTVFAVPFKFMSGSHLSVTKTLTSSGVVVPLTLTLDYTVSGAGSVNGGSITLVAGSRCATGYTLSIKRTTPKLNAKSFRSSSTLSPASVEDAVDQLAIVDQEIVRDQAVKDATQDAALAQGSAGGSATMVTATGGPTKTLADWAAMGPVAASSTTVTIARGTDPVQLADLFPFHVAAFGAKCDGSTNDTDALQRAVDAAHAAGGGSVILPCAVCRVNGTLTVYDWVTIRGCGGDMYGWNNSKQTTILHSPSSPGTTFMLVKPDPGIGPANHYSQARIEGLSIQATANSGDGIYVQDAVVAVKDVVFQGFGWGVGLRFRGSMNSTVEHARFSTCATGVSFDSTGTTNTSVTFKDTYFSLNTRAVVIQNAGAITFTDNTIFESGTGDVITIDNAQAVHFFAPYFENNASRLLVAGATSSVYDLVVEGGFFQTGAGNDSTKDGIYLDRVTHARIAIESWGMPRASIIRTTSNTGQVTWLPPRTHSQYGSGAVSRADSTYYSKGQILTAAADDGVNRYFEVTIAGTTAAGQPAGYTRTTYDLADGTAHVTSYALFPNLGIFYYPDRVVQIGGAENPVPVVAGKVRLKSSNDAAMDASFNGTAVVLTKGIVPGGVTFANLPAGPSSGMLLYCSDCTIASPCASGGSGAIAKRLGAAWVCN